MPQLLDAQDQAEDHDVSEPLSVPDALSPPDHPIWALTHVRPGEPLPPAVSPDEFGLALQRMIMRESEKTVSPFLRLFFGGKLSKDVVGEWVAQWYYYARGFPSLIAQIVANAWAQYDVRQIYGPNLMEELGQFDAAREHPLLLKRVGLALGVSEDALEYVLPLPEVLVVGEYRMHMAKTGTFLETVAGASLALELALPNWYRKVAIAMKAQFGLTDHDLEFFWIHCGRPGVEGDYGGDVQHAKEALDVIKRYATTAEQQERCRQAVYRSIEAKKVFFWGLFRNLVLERDPKYRELLGS